MRPSVNPDIVRAKAQPARNDTAYLIFDKEQVFYTLLTLVTSV